MSWAGSHLYNSPSMGGGTGSINAREAVNALATEIAAKGRQDGAPHPRGRYRQGLHVRTAPKTDPARAR